MARHAGADLLRPERFEEGDVKVFGISLESDLHAARSLIAYVPQTPYLFAGTIRENISYGRDDATYEEIVEAAKAANAHDFISAFEKQYDTVIGEHGTSLSGGERQRIAIARAFLRDAPIIILDEATSSLDNESEKLVQESMDRLMKRRTALVIAHRLSTVRNASRIVVIDNGRIVEEGTHAELIRRRGLYARLYQIQFRTKHKTPVGQTGGMGPIQALAALCRGGGGADRGRADRCCRHRYLHASIIARMLSRGVSGGRSHPLLRMKFEYFDIESNSSRVAAYTS